MIEPDEVARHIAGLVGTTPSETFVPRWYRAPALVQALAPNAVSRLIARRGDGSL